MSIGERLNLSGEKMHQAEFADDLIATNHSTRMEVGTDKGQVESP